MKHSLREILGFFSAGAGHSHEVAVQRTYDEGYAKGVADTEAKFQAGLGSPAPAPAKTEGSTSEETQKAAEGESTQTGTSTESQTPKA
jgi:hypothetical protein